MRKILMKRGQGKTTSLIYASAVTGYPILTETQVQRNRIVVAARELGLDIPEPVGLTQDLQDLNLSNVLVDDAEAVLSFLVQKYTGANVIACTLTASEDISMPGEST